MNKVSLRELVELFHPGHEPQSVHNPHKQGELATGKPAVIKAVHGTPFKFKDFAFLPRTRMSRETGEAYYFTDDRESAQDYAGPAGEVKDVELDMQNPLVYDAGGTSFRNVFPDVVLGAKNQGHDGVIVKRIRDQATLLGTDKETTTYVVFNKDQIRQQ